MPTERNPLQQTLTVQGASTLMRGLLTVPPRGSSSSTRPGLPVPGELIEGKYAVERVLGEGGMGVVLAARHTQLGKRVALKILEATTAAEKTAVARFLREARAAALLSSEHIAKVHDIGTLDTGGPYLVMDYLEGADLGRIRQSVGAFAIPDAVDAVLQACEGVAEAHAHGIVHRDLKPSNLFVTRRMDGTPLVKVLDFGISKMTQLTASGDEQNLTASGLAMGSPLYMSPEQIRSAKEVDQRTDIWALGVILYELITGVTPFASDTTGETLAKIFSEPPPALLPLRPDVPEGLAAVILQCLERDPRRRVQSVAELATKLRPFAVGDAALSVERILHISAARPMGPVEPPRVAPGSETLTVDPGALLFAPPNAAKQMPGVERSATEPAWLKSTSRAPRVPGAARTIGLAAAAGVLLVAAGATYALCTRARTGGDPSATRVTYSTSASGQTQAPGPQSAVRLADLPPPAPASAVPEASAEAPPSTPPRHSTQIAVPPRIASSARSQPALEPARPMPSTDAGPFNIKIK